MDNFIEEKYIEKSPNPITIEGTENILHQMKNCICKIINNDGNKGTGFFCRVPYKDKLLPVLITNNHVINENYLENNIKIELTLNDGKKDVIIDLDKSRIKFTNKELDVTFIEIKSKQDKIYNFLDIDENINTELGNYYNNKSIYVLHYPKGTSVNVSYGLSHRINEYNINHLCSTEVGSSGSPILLLDTFRVIGIHKGTPRNSNSKFNLGTLIKFAIQLFNKENDINNNKYIKNNYNNEVYKRNKNNQMKNNIIGDGINNMAKNNIQIMNNDNNVNYEIDKDLNNSNSLIYNQNINNIQENLMMNNNINGINNMNSQNNMNISMSGQYNQNYMINNNYNNLMKKEINNINLMNNKYNMIGSNQMNYNQTLIRLYKEFDLCKKDIYLPQIVSNFELMNDNIFQWRVTMFGPKNTPYENGLFKILITFPFNYPKNGAEFKFQNKVYHLNVDLRENGDFGHISLTTLNQWRSCGKVKSKKGYNVKNALFDIFCLFYNQGTDSAYDCDMAKLYRDDRDKFNKKAKKWTKLYASN